MEYTYEVWIQTRKEEDDIEREADTLGYPYAAIYPHHVIWDIPTGEALHSLLNRLYCVTARHPDYVMKVYADGSKEAIIG